jgi:signal transduction histidine kinase
MTVFDNGSGVPDKIKDKIFDIFFTTKDLDKLSGENNGIGLYGVKENIKELGYKITVENNTILCGANFKITF